MEASAQAGNMQRHISLVGPQGHDGVEEFWKESLNQRWAQVHPAIQNLPVSEYKKMIPVWWHADGVEFYRNTEFFVWSWSSAVAEALNIWDQKFVHVVLPALFVHLKHLFQAMNEEITKLIGWDLRVCEEGVAATTGFYGEAFNLNCSRARIAGKALAFKGCYAGFKSDGKARRDVHGFVRHYSCTYSCEECWATQPFKNAPPATNYKDFRSSALWRMTHITHEVYMGLPEQKSPWVLHVRGARLDTFYRDIMHVVYLGFARDFLASVIVAEMQDQEFSNVIDVEEAPVDTRFPPQ